MSAVIIEHVNIADLPPSWRARLTALSAGRVTVRIETEEPSTNDANAHADPAFGMWADRADVSDPAVFAQKLRESRYNSDGLRSGA
jgi:hypothetical protein